MWVGYSTLCERVFHDHVNLLGVLLYVGWIYYCFYQTDIYHLKALRTVPHHCLTSISFILLNLLLFT